MTAKKIVLTALGAALVAGAALPAFAGPGRDGPDRHDGPRRAAMQDVMFVRLLKNADSNKDGKISKDELTARQDALFAEVDTNKDGAVSRGELVDYRYAKREEFRKNNPAPEPATDQDDDDRDDGDRRAENRRERHEARWDDPRHDGMRHGGMMGRGFFRMVDEDRDGKISKAEATAAGEKLLARMDKNKDNTITIDDLPDRPL